jgi:hypothetical protein
VTLLLLFFEATEGSGTVTIANIGNSKFLFSLIFCCGSQNGWTLDGKTLAKMRLRQEI